MKGTKKLKGKCHCDLLKVKSCWKGTPRYGRQCGNPYCPAWKSYIRKEGA